MRVLALCALAGALSVWAPGAAAAPAAAAGPVVNTTAGAVQGSAFADYKSWLNIPYAEPPLGARRWANPTPKTPWTGVRQATTFGPACPQQCNLPPSACQFNGESEDCLSLNVFAPSSASASSKLPVLVWFHGGRYIQGSAGSALYDGRFLAQQGGGQIVVTANYRLGVLGFLVSETISGNFGVLDQRVVLHWVQANIAAFGGDPSRVTISGQSAGATSVAFHMTSKGSFGLYHQAILESSPFGLPLTTVSEGAKRAKHFADEAGCKTDDMACLRALSAGDVVAAQVVAERKIYLDQPTLIFFPWTPAVDHTELTGQPVQLFASGDFNHVPVIIGDVTEEARMFIWEVSPTKPLKRDECEVVIDAVFRLDLEKVKKEYPINHNTTDCRSDLSRLGSDYILDCPSREVGQNASSFYPTYWYSFDHAWSFHGAWGPNFTFCEDHCCHGAELPFVFGTASLTSFSFSPAEAQLASTIMAYWSNFVQTGNPNGSGSRRSNNATLPAWPAFAPGSNQVLHISTESIAPQQYSRGAFCDFWTTIGYHH